MGKRSDENEPRPRYGITPQAFIEFGWLVLLAAMTLGGIIFQWLTN